MSNEVTTTVQLTFGSGDSNKGHLSAEVDNRPGGLNGGKTKFSGGEPVYVLLYKSRNVSITQKLVSAGSIYPGQNQLIDMEEIITFQNKREASLSKPVSGMLDVTWLGNSLGWLTVDVDQTTVNASGAGVAVAKVSYKTEAQSYRISTPRSVNGETNYSLIFFAAGVVY